MVDSWKSEPEKGHGRIKTREILTASADWIEDKGDWMDIQTIIRYRCTREIDEAKSVSVRHYISSFDTNAESCGNIIRGHWSVENQLPPRGGSWFFNRGMKSKCFYPDQKK